MSDSYSTSIDLPDFSLWQDIRDKRIPLAVIWELTARCNNDCRHCYINLPGGDRRAQQRELSVDEIKTIADEAAALGSLWCLLTGGEPLLRPDFDEIYRYLKSKGFLVSVFTNGCLIDDSHIQLFRAFPPRDIEITVYGASAATYERISQKPGSFAAFQRGLARLQAGGVKFRLKAMALRSNFAEMPAIAAFCREHTKDFFRFDPQLHLRFDGNTVRNALIQAERLSPRQIVELEVQDPQRMVALEKSCRETVFDRSANPQDCLIQCGAGNKSFTIGYDGVFRLCSSLCHPDCVYSLRQGTLSDAWHNFVPRVRAMTSQHSCFLENCRRCSLLNLCLWCPAHAYLETGKLDRPVDYFCRVTHARAKALGIAIPSLPMLDQF